MLNAVLRRLAAEGRKLLEGQDAPRLNTPKWLWDSWAAAYGEDHGARDRRGASGRAAARPLRLARPRALGRRAGAEILPTGTLRRRSGGLIDALPGYDEGHLVGAGRRRRPARDAAGRGQGRRVLDIGAAPAARRRSSRHGCEGHRARALAQARRVPGAQPRPAVDGRRDRRGRRAGVAAAGPVRRHPAGRALHRHRHDPPPPGRALGQVAGRRGAARRRSGPAARRQRSACSSPAACWSTPSARCSPRRVRSGSRPCSRPIPGSCATRSPRPSSRACPCS